MLTVAFYYYVSTNKLKVYSIPLTFAHVFFFGFEKVIKKHAITKLFKCRPSLSLQRNAHHLRTVAAQRRGLAVPGKRNGQKAF